MKTINVFEDFVLTLDDHTKRAFKKGMHEVEDEIANHWYTQAHSKPIAAAEAAPAPPSEPPPAETPGAEAAVNAQAAEEEAVPEPSGPTPPQAGELGPEQPLGSTTAKKPKGK